MTRPTRTGGKAALREFSESLPMLLLRARESVMSHFRLMLRTNGLTEQQWRVLRALAAEHGEMDVSRLAAETYLLAPSLTRMLRDLDAQRLIATRSDPGDQRRKLVRLTLEGQDRIASVAPLSEAIYAEIAERFGGESLAELQRLLGDLQAKMRRED